MLLKEFPVPREFAQASQLKYHQVRGFIHCVDDVQRPQFCHSFDLPNWVATLVYPESSAQAGSLPSTIPVPRSLDEGHPCNPRPRSSETYSSKNKAAA